MIRSELPSFLSNIEALASMQAEMSDLAQTPEPDPIPQFDPNSNVISIIGRMVGVDDESFDMSQSCAIDELEIDTETEWDEVVITGELTFNPSLKSSHALTMGEVEDKMDDLKSILSTLGCEINFNTVQSYVFADEDGEFG